MSIPGKVSVCATFFRLFLLSRKTKQEESKKREKISHRPETFQINARHK
jgi:hypothetical protein